MTAGRLNQRITIQHLVDTQNTLGEKVKVWTDLYTDMSAEVLRASTREPLQASQYQNEATIRFRVRYRTGIDNTMRVVWKATIYAIVGDPMNVHGGNQWLDIEAKSGARDGR